VAPRDPFDVDLSVVRERVDDLGVGLAVWSYRREPDAHARRATRETARPPKPDRPR
jgi:hypothetical protein